MQKKRLSSTAGILLINYQKSYDMHISDTCKINLQTNNFLFWRRSYLCIRRTLATCSPAHMTAIFNFNNCIFPLETPVKNSVQTMEEFFFICTIKTTTLFLSILKHILMDTGVHVYFKLSVKFCDFQKTLNWFQSSINLTLFNVIMCITHIYCDLSIWTFHLQAQNSLDNR